MFVFLVGHSPLNGFDSGFHSVKLPHLSKETLCS